MAYINSLIAKITIYLAIKAQNFLLLIEKITIRAEYLNFISVFLKKLAELLPKETRANEYMIKLDKDQ